MSRRVYVIRQRRDKTIEYFSGFRRSFFFISLKEAARSQERECGMVVWCIPTGERPNAITRS